MVEPVEYLAEATLLEVEELLKKKLLLDILCIPFPDKHALEAEMRPIADAIVKGRNSKGSEDSLIYMQSALDMVTALRDKLRKQARPDRWHDRMFAIRFGVVTLTVGAFLGLGLKVGYDHLTKTPVHQEPANNPKGVP
jgi:hypothetical protein